MLWCGDVMSKQSDKEGQTTLNPHDGEPNRRKVQLSKSVESPVKKINSEPYRIGAVAAKMHVTVFAIRARRKNIPLDERRQITIGEFVYRRHGSKWDKYRKGDNKILDTVNYPPIYGGIP